MPIMSGTPNSGHYNEEFVLSLFLQFAITFKLFYDLLSLKEEGWYLQIFVSSYFLFVCVYAAFMPSFLPIYNPFENIPHIFILPWFVFNAYTLHYFLQMDIINLFCNPKKVRKKIDKEYTNIFEYTNALVEKQSETKISPEKTSKKKNTFANTRYIENARVLLTTPKSISELNKMEELNKAIDRSATQIIVMLKKILPHLKDGSVIDDRIYEHYQHYSWKKEDIIKNFKLQASQLCTDKSNFQDKFFQYSKKIDELELLTKTEHLMDSWLKDTGNEIGDLISYDYI